MIWDVELREGDEGVLVTLWFAGCTFLCAVEWRRGVVLGVQLGRPSDSSSCVFEFLGGDVLICRSEGGAIRVCC